MVVFTDTLREDGLARAHRALARLQGDPLRVDCERQRFSHSPPPYTSNPSSTTARSASPNPPSAEQQRRQERRVLLGLEHRASKPYAQFEHQISDEEKRIWNSELNRTPAIPVGSDQYTIARENVKKRWVEQGIWNNKWNQSAYGRWKHEEPLELDSQSEKDTEVGPSLPLYSFFPKQPQPQPKLRRPKCDDEKRRIAERRVEREREREASRPYHQFVYQISKERERIQEESTNREDADAAHINTRAYENVKKTWTKRGIWNKRWGILPGMSWKHEEPLDEEAADNPASVAANPLLSGSRKVPAIRIFGSPSPVESNHCQSYGTMNISQQGPPADTDSASLENGDAEPSPSAPNSPRLRTGKRVLHPKAGQISRPSKEKPSHKNGQLQPATNPSLGPVYSSKVSKAASMKKPRPQLRLKASQKVSSDGLPLSSGMDTAEPQPSPPPDSVTPRRSKRILSQ